MKKGIKKIIVLTVTLAVFVGCFGAGRIYAAKKKVHEYYWMSFVDYTHYKDNKILVKTKGNKLFVKGKAYLKNKLYPKHSKTSKLKYKKRMYKMTKKSKFYKADYRGKITRISKKKAIKALCTKYKTSAGFQILFKSKKIVKLYIIYDEQA